MGMITPLLDELGADPAIIVGGQAVEFYTSGSYTTVDVDLVMIRTDIAKRLFELLGFELQDNKRHFYIKELDMPIEIPHDRLEGSKEHVVKLTTPDGYCYIIGVEDLILDRLRAATYWKDKRSEEWATYLLSIHFDQLNMEYIKEKAEEEDSDLRIQLNKQLQKLSHP